MSVFTGGDALPFHRHSDVLNARADDAESLTRLVEELKRRGNAAFAQKSFPEADALYSKALEVISGGGSSDPLLNQHVFLANRSAARAAMGQGQLALEDADACVRLQPAYAKGHFRKAQALHKLARFSDALAALKQAQALEPGNKSVDTLFAQIEALAKQQAAAPPAAAAPTSPKKVTRVAVAKETATVSASAKETVAETEDDDEKIVGAVRGYKKLADGRVTTFFNNELSEEAKQLIGDIAPKKVADAHAVQIKSVDGGSAWNVGNTFEERDMTAWAKSRLEVLFAGVEASLPAGAGVVTAGAVRDLSGDASIAVVRGAKRYIFDFAFTLECALEPADGSERVQGELRFLDVSSDAGGESDVDTVVPSRYQSAAGKALHAALASPTSPFRTTLQKRLDAFVTEYHAF